MGVMSELAIEIYEEVESLMEDVGHAYLVACVIVAYDRNIDLYTVKELTEDLCE